MSITSPACTLVNLHNDKRAPASISALSDKGSFWVFTLRARSKLSSQNSSNKWTCRAGRTAPSAHILALRPPLCPLGPFFLQACQHSDHRMGGLNINLWFGLSDTHTQTHTEWSYKLLERAGCHVVQRPNRMKRLLDEEGMAIYLSFIYFPCQGMCSCTRTSVFNNLFFHTLARQAHTHLYCLGLLPALSLYCVLVITLFAVYCPHPWGIWKV